MEHLQEWLTPDIQNMFVSFKKFSISQQAPRAWFDRFSAFLLKYSFCTLADPSLFVYHSIHGTLILLLYVDDMLLTGSPTALLSTFI